LRKTLLGVQGAVDVGAMFDPGDAYDVLVLEDPVHDAVRAAACRYPEIRES